MAKEFDIYLNRRLTECDIIVYSIPYRDGLTDTGRVIVNGNRDGVKRARRKIKAFKNKIEHGEMTYEDLWTSVNGILAYFGAYDDHNRVLRLRRLFYSIYGFSPEHIENFRRQGVTNEIHNTSEIQERSYLWKSEYSSYV